jgi:hypothetical protein
LVTVNYGGRKKKEPRPESDHGSMGLKPRGALSTSVLFELPG